MNTSRSRAPHKRSQSDVRMKSNSNSLSWQNTSRSRAPHRRSQSDVRMNSTNNTSSTTIHTVLETAPKRESISAPRETYDPDFNLSTSASLCTTLVPELTVTLSTMNLDSEDKQCSTDLHRSQRDLHPLLLETDQFVQGNHVATELPHTTRHNNVVADDEISDKTDTFAPFYTEESEKDHTNFIDQITFEGDENLQRRCKALCHKYRHIFTDTLNPEPAAIPPFDLSEQMASVVLHGLTHMICEMYLDDGIIYGKGNDQFLERIQTV
jgi:hypothetical protein